MRRLARPHRSLLPRSPPLQGPIDRRHLGRPFGSPLLPVVRQPPKNSDQTLPPTIPRRASMLRVVFICSGNICRSPMAHAIFEHEASRRRIPHIAVSMGTLGLVNQPAADEAISSCRDIGVELSYHQSQPISTSLLRHATHIFIMEPQHAEALKKHGIDDARVQYLGAWDPVDPRPEIDDPVEQPRAVFDACRQRIERAIDSFLRAQAPTAAPTP